MREPELIKIPLAVFDIDEDQIDLVEDIMRRIVSQIKSEAPVDTGRMRDSIIGVTNVG